MSAGILIGIAWNLQSNLEIINILTILTIQILIFTLIFYSATLAKINY